MTIEPSAKRTIAFFDGQNLYHAARHAFGYAYPNYDPLALASAISKVQGWDLAEVRFYTGVPDREDNPFWRHFWTNKLAHLGRRGPPSTPGRWSTGTRSSTCPMERNTAIFRAKRRASTSA